MLAALGAGVFTDYWVDAILTQSLLFGIAAASLIFLSAYGGMISLAQTALMGIAGFVARQHGHPGGAGGETKGLTLGWDPTLSLVLAILVRPRSGCSSAPSRSRSLGIYFLMLTLTFARDRHLLLRPGDASLGGFSAIAGINQLHAAVRRRHRRPPDRLYYIALGVALVVYVLIRYLVRTPFGLVAPGSPRRARAHERRSDITFRSTARSRSASPRSSRRLPACSTSGGTARSRRSDLGLGATIDL